jgi:two-component system sensor histidine kinase KdpD
MTNRIARGWQLIFAHTDETSKVRFLGQCFVGLAAVVLLTYLGFVLRANSLTIGFLYMCIVLAAALRFGFWQASFASVIAVCLLDYYFLPPLYSFQIRDANNWVALAVFEFTAITVSRLSTRELNNARQAAIHRTGMSQLYELSRSSLLLDMHQAPGPQLVVLIHRIFGAEAVALYDANLGRQDRMGDWAAGEEDVAKESFLRDAGEEDNGANIARRILRAGPGPVGALAVRGNLDSLVLDAFASLAAIAMDRHQWFEKEERAETSRQSEQLRAAVMDALAHEFKTPLTAVHTASSGLLLMGGLTDQQNNLVSLIDDQAVRMNALCTRLLRTAKIEADRVGLKSDEVNIEELVNEVLAGQDNNAGKDRRVHVLVDDPALTLQADRGLLAMILAQFIDNAKKYSTPDTPIEIAARKSRTEVLISVHNFGSTIRIEDRERIFDRFYRSSDVMESVAGTGIGLSVVRKAAEAHHGHVWVISDETEGTTFYLSLPVGARRNV